MSAESRARLTSYFPCDSGRYRPLFTSTIQRALPRSGSLSTTRARDLITATTTGGRFVTTVTDWGMGVVRCATDDAHGGIGGAHCAMRASHSPMGAGD